jgi:DNA-binding response OmpR family regulator
MADITLSGLHVLVVEDEATIAMLIEDALDEEGSVVVGPYATVVEALQMAQLPGIDFALLDMSLLDGRVYPVAAALSRRNIPFILISGYGEDAAPPDHPEWPCQSKPFKCSELLSRMRELLRGR